MTITPMDGCMYFRNLEFHNYAQFSEALEDCEKNIRRCKEKLLMMAAGTPKDLFPQNSEDNDTLFDVHKEFSEVWEWLEELIIEKGKLDTIMAAIEDATFDGKMTIDLDSAFEKVCKFG